MGKKYQKTLKYFQNQPKYIVQRTDTIEIYRELINERDPNAREVLVNLFKNEFQANYIHRLFYNAQSYKRATRMPEILYNIQYADNLVNQRQCY